jgi:hypothetical protein
MTIPRRHIGERGRTHMAMYVTSHVYKSSCIPTSWCAWSAGNVDEKCRVRVDRPMLSPSVSRAQIGSRYCANTS